MAPFLPSIISFLLKFIARVSALMRNNSRSYFHVSISDQKKFYHLSRSECRESLKQELQEAASPLMHVYIFHFICMTTTKTTIEGKLLPSLSFLLTLMILTATTYSGDTLLLLFETFSQNNNLTIEMRYRCTLCAFILRYFF